MSAFAGDPVRDPDRGLVFRAEIACRRRRRNDPGARLEHDRADPLDRHRRSGCGSRAGRCLGLSTSCAAFTGMSPRTTARRRMPWSSISALRCVGAPTFACVIWSRMSSTTIGVISRNS